MSVFCKDNLVAWCIVPFDACKRGPKQRAEMLKRLGIRSLAYDWRDEHIATFDDELAELRAHDIRLLAFFVPAGLPVDENSAWEDPQVRASLEFLKRNRLKVDVWAIYRGEGAEDLSNDEQKYAAAARRVGVLAGMVNELGCRLGVYNHGGWGGQPRTMVEIVKRLESKGVGIVYNFHHAHEHLDAMPGAFQDMLPYLMCVNLNGMSRCGPKILPLGQGREDLTILRMIQDCGYKGPIGILDHRVETDAELSLRENLDGMQKLLAELGDEAALATYRGDTTP